MTKDYLPNQVDPLRFAENAADLQGAIPLAKMERLAASLLNKEGDVNVQLKFGINKQKTRFIKGHIDALLDLQCQRCMCSFMVNIVSDFTYGIVTKDEEVKKLPENYDPLIVKNDELFIHDMIEEELIINLPIVPMHDPEICNVSLPIMVSDPKSAGDILDNPFKVIESLKVKPKQE